MEEKHKEKASILTGFPYSKEIIAFFAALAAIGVAGGFMHGFLAELMDGYGYYRVKGLLEIIEEIPGVVWSLAAIGGALALYFPLMNSMKRIVPSVGPLWTLFIIIFCLEEATGYISEIVQLLFSIAAVVIMIILGVKINKSFGGKISTFGTVFWVCPLFSVIVSLALTFGYGDVDSIETLANLLYVMVLVLGSATYIPLNMIRDFTTSDLKEIEVEIEESKENKEPEN